MGLLIYSNEALFGFGAEGSDAGHWRFNPVTGKLEWVPGWEVERFSDLLAAVSGLEEVVRIKNPRVFDSIGADLGRFVHEELTTYLKESMSDLKRSQ